MRTTTQYRLVRRAAPELIVLDDLGVPAGHQQLLLSLGELQLQFVRGSYAERLRGVSTNVARSGTDRVEIRTVRHYDGTIVIMDMTPLASVVPSEEPWYKLRTGPRTFGSLIPTGKEDEFIRLSIESC
jgi:hypothetical protein